MLATVLFAARAQPAPSVTFSTDIARIVHQRCSYCHHDGQSAPFNLLTYQDVRKRADTILKALESGAMPPWLAEPGYGEFSNDRRLPDDEKLLLVNWLKAGAPEGDPTRAPPPPTWSSGWLEGPPDLIVKMDKPFELGPDGADVYRHFVIPVSLPADRFVRAVQFAPGNPRIVHHAFIRVDDEGLARKLDGADGSPGIDRMVSTARMPGGQFLTWNPGSRPAVAPKGLAWRLRKNSDLVVETHLNRTGKPETLQASIGFYFTDEPPTNSCFTFKLGSFALDFPAGATNELVRDSMVLPVDVDLLAIYPHAHFLAKEMKGWAILPNGEKQWLIWIKQWDFNWQGDYRFKTPVNLPKGTALQIEYSYDNSTNNPANPHHPPRRVVYGDKSNDEMCEMGFQVLARGTNELQILQEHMGRHRLRQSDIALRKKIADDPNDAESLTRLGINLMAEHRRPEAGEFLDRAVKVRPDLAEARYNRGVFIRFGGRPAEARRELEEALRLDPKFPKAHQQLGFAFAELGMASQAEAAFVKALELNPADTVSRDALAQLRQYLNSQARR